MGRSSINPLPGTKSSCNPAVNQLSSACFDLHRIPFKPCFRMVFKGDCLRYPGGRTREFVPGHALHEKGLQRQKGVGPLASSKEQRALLVPLINRLSTASLIPPPVYIGFPLFVLPRICSRQLSSMLWRTRGTLVSWAEKPVGVPSLPGRPAVRRPTRPASGVSGFWIRQV